MRKLPSQLWLTICRFTGIPARTSAAVDRLNIDHLLETYPRPSQEIHWVLAMSDELGNFYKSGDDLLFHSIRAQSLYLQGDYLRRVDADRH